MVVSPKDRHVHSHTHTTTPRHEARHRTHTNSHSHKHNRHTLTHTTPTPLNNSTTCTCHDRPSTIHIRRRAGDVATTPPPWVNKKGSGQAPRNSNRKNDVLYSTMLRARRILDPRPDRRNEVTLLTTRDSYFIPAVCGACVTSYVYQSSMRVPQPLTVTTFGPTCERVECTLQGHVGRGWCGSTNGSREGWIGDTLNGKDQ